ncbi:MAG TPA: ATP-binding protein [Bdellovibrionales bacterium]|nr:ATP-binding protein [Bdellovibrionales bacterium]
MIIHTLFSCDGRLEPGQVEVKLLPGIPQLHIVGLPDASIRESGIKVKSALRSAGFQWPIGQQIVVSLRPAGGRKSGAGVELAIALAYLAMSGQLPRGLEQAVMTHAVFGELGLNAEVIAPTEIARALLAGERPLLTGPVPDRVREGEWIELAYLGAGSVHKERRAFDWSNHWRPPSFEGMHLHDRAAKALLLTAHMRLGVLVAGPQGTGKSTWAKMAHALSGPPDPKELLEREALILEDKPPRWRPLEQPHHTTSVLGMVGGGLPLVPGVITRAHGGILLMDEFLEFHPLVLEALREPMEVGSIELARKGRREKFPARFQLIGTTNLCPCGRLNPLSSRACNYALGRCRATIQRMSGPLLDRFDMLVLSHEWMADGRLWSWTELKEHLDQLREFRAKRSDEIKIPDHYLRLGLNHRRRKSLAKVARGLADIDRSLEVRPNHLRLAHDWVEVSMMKLRDVFA